MGRVVVVCGGRGYERRGNSPSVVRNRVMLVREPRPVLVVAFPGGDETADMVRQSRLEVGVEVLEVA